MRRLITLFLLLFSIFARAEQASISGSVLDQNDEPLAGAYIILKGTAYATWTNSIGKFHFLNLTPADYEIEVSFIGYITSTQNVVLNESSLNMNFSLQPGTIQLAEVVIASAADRSINTFSKLDINIRPVVTSQDILRIVPGLFIAQHAGGGKAEQIFLRGFDIDHGTDIHLEVDGLPVNMVSHAHGQGYSDLHFIIPELIQYVDFEKGPYYADKGNFATAGFVSFHTKNKLDRNFFKAEGGQFGTGRFVTGLKVLDRLTSNAYVAAEYTRTDGYFESSQNFNRINITGKYNLDINERNKLTALATYFNSGWDASGQIPVRAIESGSISRWGSIDNTEGGFTKRINALVKHQHFFSSGSALETQAFVSRYDFNLYSNFTFFLHDPEHGDQVQQKESRMIYGARTSYFQTNSFRNSKLTTEAGVGFRYDDVQDVALSRTVKRNFLLDINRGDIHEANLNAFVSETYSRKAWTLNGAVRYDYFYFSFVDKLAAPLSGVSKSIVSPKLHVAYQVNPKNQLFLKTGSGFHSNDTRVVVQQSKSNILPKAYGLDLGITTKVSKNALLQLAVWRLDMDQEFVYVGDEGIVEPSGKTQRQGIELSVRYQILPWLYMDSDLNMTLPRNKEEEINKYIPLAPVLSSTGGVSAQFKNGWSGSLRYRYLGNRAANEDKSVLAEGYLLADGAITYAKKNFSVGFSIENIFDQQWREAQFETTSRLQDEITPVTEIHFTPGTPLSARVHLTVFF